MTDREPLHLFEATGVELEYMIVDSTTLSVRPLADELLRRAGGEYAIEIERGPISWGNELVLHVVELKTTDPAPTLRGVARTFQENIGEILAVLNKMGAVLLPTAMHPWMNPDTETRLWPHEQNEIYRTFDRIFGCRGHGWSNLQSTHINLPFCGDDEFGRLHAAIRHVLPIVPALAASSPLADARVTGFLDTRMEAYRTNALRIPSVTGRVVPESVSSRSEYEDRILHRIYRDLAPLDPDGVIHHEWVNARGSIARFDRGSIEIRVVDIQECPAADLAICVAVVSVLRNLVEETLAPYSAYRDWDEESLVRILQGTIRSADNFEICDGGYLRTLGYKRSDSCTVAELWQHLIESVVSREAGFHEWAGALEVIAREGCLARRIVSRLGPDPDRNRIREVYRDLADCLRDGALLHERS